MLKGINLLEYGFVDGHLVYRNLLSQEEKKINLDLLLNASREISVDKL